MYEQIREDTLYIMLYAENRITKELPSVKTIIFQLDNHFIAILFGTFKNSSYLCTVRTIVLAIRVESRGGRTLMTPPQEQDITNPTPF